MERCSIGLIGWGVVGGGVIDILQRDAALFHERCGLDLHLKTIVDLDLRRKRPQSPGQATVTDRVDALLSDREISVIIHLVPGTTAAKTVCLACLNAGKHVVTANKALLAEHGDELFAVAASTRYEDCRSGGSDATNLARVLGMRYGVSSADAPEL